MKLGLGFVLLVVSESLDIGCLVIMAMVTVMVKAKNETAVNFL